jgi:hypothetical protein
MDTPKCCSSGSSRRVSLKFRGAAKRRVHLLVTILIMTAVTLAFSLQGYAQCKSVTTKRGVKCANPDARCNEGYGNGRCINLSDGECQCSADTPPPPVQGVYEPMYYILALVYAPPGCTSTPSLKCGTQSMVDYQQGSSNGTKTSIQSSFSSSSQITANVGLDNIKGLNPFSASYGFSDTSTDTTTETISKSQTLEIKVQGNQDGVNHDQDFFYILLNPAIGVSIQGTNAQWNMGYWGPSALWYQIYVSELKDPSSMPPAVATQLQQLGFTNTDYQTILSQDPFANGSTSIDPTRFIRTNTTFPYEPPPASACVNGVCTCASLSNSIKNDFQTETSTQTQSQYTVSFTAGFTIPVLGGIGLSTTDKFTWTNQSSKANSTDASQTATAVVSCPSTSYTGAATFMAVYWDTLYGSFMFDPIEDQPASAIIHAGRVVDASGTPVRQAAVDLSYGGKTYHTYTDNNGAYRFFRYGVQPKTIAELIIGGTQQLVVVGNSVPLQTRIK